MPNPNPSPATRFQRGHKTALKDPRLVRSKPIRVSARDTDLAQSLGYTNVQQMLDALHTGEAIVTCIAHEYSDQRAETIAHLSATIEAHRYKWHPSHTEDLLRGVIAALEKIDNPKP
jgi:hypothetical protein